MAKRRLETISEIAVRNELPFSQVALTYLIFNLKVYAKNMSKGKEFKWYSPCLERATYKLTEEYIDNQKISKYFRLDKLIKSRELKKINPN